ncbi:CIC11C00000003166 [Sungouiella intermedia]|uniref:CIC11C00000003166 n=1 Tax=Sungouiella intermedia TaxID=45354 RepID=A0A1L0DM43_9ASCO|nr:CIC11C00000003166 [[Candida] intermedia]
MSALPSSRKTHSERHKQILKQLLKEPANKTCVDCKTAAHPRWASWNLGCFICIRCSGIHRLMGTHISRVKSVDLDAWTDEQVELMVKWGNAKCNAYWEAKLPEGYVPDGLKIENFIRTKYDLKKWAASSLIPDPMNVSVAAGASGTAGIVASEGSATSTTSSSTSRNAPLNRAAAPNRTHAPLRKVTSPASAPPSLLDDDFGSFTSSPLPTPTPAQQTTRQTSHIHKQAQSHHKHAQVPPVAVNGIHGSQSTGLVPNKQNERTDLKKSILSLYSLPSSSQTSVQSGQTYGNNLYGNTANTYGNSYGNNANTQRTNTNGTSNANVAAMTDSLLGLNFGSAPSPASQSISQSLSQSKTEPVKQDKSVPHYKNEWSDSSSSVNKWGSSVGNSSSSVASAPTGLQGTYSTNYTSNYTSNVTPGATTALDDDLFKNVWS